MDSIFLLEDLRIERMMHKIKALDPGFPRDDPMPVPSSPAQFPTDVPAPEPRDVPAPEPRDVPPPESTPNPGRSPQDPKPRPIP
jgi:fused signal recognition particle receptor